MKRILLFPFLCWATLLAARAATSPVYENLTPVYPPLPAPQVDATVFINRSTFEVDTTVGMALPWRTANTYHFTNTGLMIGWPGFIFDLSRNGTATNGSGTNGNAFMAASFHNQGEIGSSNYFRATATNFTNPGRLTSSETGLMYLEATKLWLGRAALKGGDVPDFSVYGQGYNIRTNAVGTNVAQVGYVPEASVTDLHWGNGFNNVMGTNGVGVLLTQLTDLFRLPAPVSFPHEVLGLRSVTPSLVTVGASNGCSGAYTAYVHTNQITPTASNLLVQVVFVPTDSLLSSNIFTDVRFIPVLSNASTFYVPIVQFSSLARDTVDFQSVPHSAYLLDWAAVQGTYTLGNPPYPLRSHRPGNFELTRDPLLNDLFGFYEPSNNVLSPTLFFSPFNTSNTVNLQYGAYAAQLGQTNSQFLSQFGNVKPAFSDPSNFLGRVEITSDTLHVEQTRIRAENFISFQTRNLVSNLFAHLDAPFVNFDVATTNAALVIDQVLPATVDRLSGRINAYSALWDTGVNQIVLGTNGLLVTNVLSVRYQVLIVDNCVRGEQDVVLNKFAAHGTNLVIKDSLIVNAGLLLDAQRLEIGEGGRVAFPTNWSWLVTNVGFITTIGSVTNAGVVTNISGFASLLTLTNNGEIKVPATAYFGSDTPNPSTNAAPAPYEDFINHGFVTAAAMKIRAGHFENAGTLALPEIATVQSLQGALILNVAQGLVSNASLIANGDLEIHAGDLTVVNSTNRAGTRTNRFVPNPPFGAGSYIPGLLVLDVTNRLTDGFTNWVYDDAGLLKSQVVNEWETTGGFQLRQAAGGSLLGSRFISRANKAASVNHTWAGRDLGPTPAGYTNNLAVGWLTLDSPGPNSLFVFNSATGSSNALYVDYLELRNDALNYLRSLSIGPNMMVYFADANVPPPKLDGKAGGRLRWVRDYAGPHSYTNLLYPNLRTYTFNYGLVRDKDIDSNGNGFVNADDPFPIDVPGSGLSIAVGLLSPSAVVLEWPASSSFRYSVGVKTTLNAASWTLTNLGSIDGLMRWTNTVRLGETEFYRVQVDGGTSSSVP